MLMHTLDDVLKHLFDFLSISTLIGVLMGVLPHLTAVLVAIWTGMRIYESYLNIKEKHEQRAEKEQEKVSKH